MKYILTIFLWMPALCFAQKTIVLDESWERVVLDEVPPEKMPKQASALMFVNSYADSSAAFYFGYIVANDQLKVLGKFYQDAEWLNLVKSAVSFSNDTIELWSQQPYRATQTVYTFRWKNKKIRFISSETTDPSWEAITQAEEALKKGKIKEAIEWYYQVQYPMTYMNEEVVGFQILSKANEFALMATKDKDHARSVAYIQQALEWWTLQNYVEAEDEAALTQIFEEQFTTEYKDSFGLWMGNYGYFLYRADSLEKSIEINRHVNKLYPQLAGPFLQHADALYDLNKKYAAKQIYLKYMALMKERGKDRSVPDRVLDRIK